MGNPQTIKDNKKIAYYYQKVINCLYHYFIYPAFVPKRGKTGTLPIIFPSPKKLHRTMNHSEKHHGKTEYANQGQVELTNVSCFMCTEPKRIGVIYNGLHKGSQYALLNSGYQCSLHKSIPKTLEHEETLKNTQYHFCWIILEK